MAFRPLPVQQKQRRNWLQAVCMTGVAFPNPEYPTQKNVCRQSIVLSMKAGKEYGVCVREVCVYCHSYLVTGTTALT